MRKWQWPWLKTAVLGSVLTLAACGGPAAPLPPAATGTSPTAAARGDAITIVGTHFGTTPGTLTIGGVDAVVTAWTDTTIEASVPDGAPNAWQDVTVTTPGGSSTVAGLFVGAAFTGTAAELQGFLDGLELGTAVLLQAETYDLGGASSEFFVDNKDLYGRGQDQTNLILPELAATVVLAEFGESTSLVDLSVTGENLLFLPGTVTDTFLPTAHDAVAPAGAENPQVTLERFTFEATTPLPWGSPISDPPKIDLTVRDATLDLGAGSLAFASSGNILFEGVDATMAGLELITLVGSLELHDTSLTVTGQAALAADAGLTIADSAVNVTGGSLQLIGAANAALAGSTIAAGGAIEITGSTIEILDDDFADLDSYGSLSAVTQFAPITVRDNVTIHTHDSVVLTTTDSSFGEGDIDFVGNADVRLGIFQAEDPVHFRNAGLNLVTGGTGLRDLITVDANVIAATEGVNVVGTGDIGLNGNTVVVGDGSEAGILTVVSTIEGRITATGNDVTSNNIVQFIAADLAGGELALSGNQFTHDAARGGTLVVQGAGGSCVLNENQILFDDPSDANSMGITAICIIDDPAGTFSLQGNELRASGAAGSLIAVVSPTGGQVSIDSNTIHSSGGLVLSLPDATADIGTNEVALTGQPLVLAGSPLTVLTLTGNTVTQANPADRGLILGDLGTATVANNTFTATGTPDPAATALNVFATSSPTNVTVTGNTFGNYRRALYFEDVAVAANGIVATVSNNVFDFTIDAAPEVAALVNVKDDLVATHNRWGNNTELATVESYVTLGGDTVGQGGSIALAPITMP